MTSAILLVCLLLWTVPLAAQERVEFRLRLSDENSSQTPLFLGLDSRATPGLDTALGEFELPLFPPDGMHAFLLARGLDGGGQLASFFTYRDYRPFVDTSNSYFVDWTVVIPPISGPNPRGNQVVFRWEPYADHIDSVVLSDVIDQALVRQSLSREGGVYRVSGENLIRMERYRVRVFFKAGRPTSVDTDPKGTKLRVYPNPVSGTLMLIDADKMELPSRYKVFAATGLQIAESDREGNTIDVTALEPGLYLLWFSGHKSVAFIKE